MSQIKSQFLSTQDPDVIPRAQAVLAAGGLVAFPTDTVYGLAAGVFNQRGIERLYEAKERSAGKAIAVLVAETAQLSAITTGLTDTAALLAVNFWPGALTLVVPIHPDLPPNLSPLPTVGVRMPNHAFSRALMRVTGPLATTSANLSGDSNTVNAQEVLHQLDGRVELVIDGGPVTGGVPSTVVDCTQSPPKVLRQGAISSEEISKALEGLEG